MRLLSSFLSYNHIQQIKGVVKTLNCGYSSLINRKNDHNFVTDDWTCDNIVVGSRDKEKVRLIHENK